MKQLVPPLPSEEFLGLVCGCLLFGLRQGIWTESDPALMRFVELIHLCSAASSSPELCCVDEAGSELMRGQVGRTRSVGLSPCPPVPSVFPRFSAVGHRPVSLGWLGKATLVTGQGFGGCSCPALCLQVSGGGFRERCGVAVGGTAEQSPSGTVFGGFRGCPVPQPCSRGKGCCASELAPRESFHG